MFSLLYSVYDFYNNNNNIMLHNSFYSDEEWPLQLFVLLLTLFLTLGIFTLEGIKKIIIIITSVLELLAVFGPHVFNLVRQWKPPAPGTSPPYSWSSHAGYKRNGVPVLALIYSASKGDEVAFLATFDAVWYPSWSLFLLSLIFTPAALCL